MTTPYTQEIVGGANYELDYQPFWTRVRELSAVPRTHIRVLVLLFLLLSVLARRCLQQYTLTRWGRPPGSVLPRLHPTKGRSPTKWMKPPPSKAQRLLEAWTPQTQGPAKGASLLANQQSLQLLLLRMIIGLQVKVEVGFSPLLSFFYIPTYSRYFSGSHYWPLVYSLVHFEFMGVSMLTCHAFCAS